MLTPEEIDAFNKATGQNVSRTATLNQPIVQSRADQIRALGKQYSQPAQTSSPSFSERVVGDIGQRANNAVQDVKDTFSGKISPQTAVTNIKSQAPAAIGDVAGEAITSVGQGVARFIPDSVKQFFHPALQTGVDALSKGIDAYKSWAEQNPEPAKNLESAFNLANFLPEEKVGAAGVEALGKTALAKTAGETLATKTAKTAATDILEMTRPILSKAEQASAVAAGKGEAGGLLKGAKIAAQGRDFERAAAVKGIADSSKDLITNVNNVRDAIGSEAKSLSENLVKNDQPFKPDELSTKIDSIEKPLSLAADDKLNKMYDLAKDKFMTFVGDKPTLSGLLKARQEFDAWVEKQVPKIWESPESKPLHQALRDIRTTANDFIAEKLPGDEASQAFKDSLKKQNLMYEARDNMAEKAVKSEVGKSKIDQVTNKIKEHPYITGGAALYGAYKTGKKFGE